MLKLTISLGIAIVVSMLLGLVVMFLYPPSLETTAAWVCPAGTTVELVKTERTTGRGRQTMLNVWCVSPDGAREAVEGSAFFALAGAFLLPLFLLFYVLARMVTLPSFAGGQQLSPLPDNVIAEVRALLKEGRKIEAVKLVHEKTGVSLAQASAQVEKLVR